MKRMHAYLVLYSVPVTVVSRLLIRQMNAKLPVYASKQFTLKKRQCTVITQEKHAHSDNAHPNFGLEKSGLFIDTAKLTHTLHTPNF